MLLVLDVDVVVVVEQAPLTGLQECSGQAITVPYVASEHVSEGSGQLGTETLQPLPWQEFMQVAPPDCRHRNVDPNPIIG